MNKLAKNYLLTGGYQILNILIMLVTTPYLTRVLGSGCLGIDSYVLSVVQICQVMGSLGTTIYANREIAYVREDRQRLTNVFWELLFLRLLLGCAVSGIYLIIAFRSRYRIVFLIQFIQLIAYYMDISWLYIGTEDVAPVTLSSAAARISATGLILFFVKKPQDLYLYVTISALSLAVISGLLLWRARRRIGPCRPAELDLRHHLKPVLALFLPQAASSLYVIFDKTMLGLLASDVSRTSIYDKAEMIVKAPTVLAVAMTTVLMPRIAHYHALNRREDIRKLVRNALDLMFLLCVPVSAGMAVVAPIFIPIYLGPGYVDSVRVVRILAPIILAIGMSNVSGAQFLIGCNETKYLGASYLASAVFNIAGNYFLIPRLDEAGASITTLCAEWMVVLIQFYAMHRLIGRIGAAGLAVKKLIAAAVMCAAILPLARLGSSLGVMFLQIASGATVYFLTLTILRDKALARGIDFLRSRGRR